LCKFRNKEHNYLENSDNNGIFAENNNVNDGIPNGSTQTELGSSQEVHSREQEVKNRLEQRVGEAEKELERPLTIHERADIKESIRIHNELFPETRYEPAGFTGIDNGKSRAPYVEPIFIMS
jgi:hypothetical protein